MSRLRLAVIGVGHLGKEHARILASFPDADLIGVVDCRPEQAEAVARRCQCRHYSSVAPLLEQLDAAVIAVPTLHHHETARECLRHGVALLVEKPLTTTVDEANDLVQLAAEKRLVLQVGHVERFNPAFEELQKRALQPKLVNARRLSAGSGRSTDVGVVLDLMIHDLDVLLTLVKSPVRSVSALGVALFGEHEDMVQAHLTFENGCVAHLRASRAHFEPVRAMEIWSPEGFAQIDFQERLLTMIQPEQSLRASTDRLPIHGTKTYRKQCDRNQPDQLTRELRDFVDAVKHHGLPRVSGEQGRNALVLAHHVLNSLQRHRWNGIHPGPVGPRDLPAPRGPLFIPESRSAA